LLVALSVSAALLLCKSSGGLLNHPCNTQTQKQSITNVVSVAEAKRVLRFTPPVPLSTAVQQTVAFHRKRFVLCRTLFLTKGFPHGFVLTLITVAQSGRN
jgi:hypothetical protein